MDHAAHRNSPLSETPLLRSSDGELVVEPTLQGRSGGMKNVKREQMFCQLASSIVDLTLVNDFSDLGTGWADSSNRQSGGVTARNCDRLWNINVRGIEVYRTSAELINPLSASVIQNGPLPAGASRSVGIHAYRLRIKVSTPSEFAIYEADCDQDIEIWGQAVEVNLLGPANAVPIGSNADTSTITRNQFVVDSIIAAAIYPIEQSKSVRDFYLTEYLRSPANTASVIRVPRGARAVKIYQGTPLVAAPSARWQRFIGDPTVVTAIPIGGINFAQRESIDNSLPEIASHLQTDVEPANQRLFTLRWTIRP